MRKAFTLIELLAVIIILAIVALIATPIILDVIEDAERSANLSEANLILGGAETFYATSKLTGENEGLFNGTTNVYETMELTGEKLEPEHAKITITKEGKIDFAVYMDGACYKKGINEDVISPTYEVEASECVLGGTTPEVPSTENITVALSTGLVPVKISYDENDASASGIITAADTNEEWYNYGNSEWANAVTVVAGTDVTPGTIIDMTNIVQMYVYIPRYKYEVFASSEPITINVVFEDKEAAGYTKEEVPLANDPASEAGEWLTHPAFSYTGDDNVTVELDGIWVGKFEQATDNKIVPNVNSVHNYNISTMSKIINSALVANQVDVHMMKNLEWGATVYLSQSNYGICKTTPGSTCKESNEATEIVKIQNNNYYNPSTYDIVTGCGGDDTAQSTTNTGINICPENNRWNTDLGIKASTTHNVTGIYDMAGGRYEYMMAVGNQDESSSGFTSLPDGKYYDNYELGDSATDYAKGLLGDGTKEMLPGTVTSRRAWNEDYATLPSSSVTWFVRGNDASSGSDAGAFAFGNYRGYGISNVSGRSVLWVVQ